MRSYLANRACYTSRSCAYLSYVPRPACNKQPRACTKPKVLTHLFGQTLAEALESPEAASLAEEGAARSALASDAPERRAPAKRLGVRDESLACA